MIRRMKKTDIDAVSGIWLDANRDTHDFIPAEYWESNFLPVKKMLLPAEVYVYIDECKNEIEGFVGLDQEYIAGIFVRKEARSKGIGKADLFLLPGQFPDRAVSHDAAVGAGLNDVPEHVRIFYFPFIQTHFSHFMKFPFFCYYQRNIVKIMRIKIITKMICPNRSDPICISSNSFG